jgi:hypothetical protein
VEPGLPLPCGRSLNVCDHLIDPADFRARVNIRSHEIASVLEFQPSTQIRSLFATQLPGSSADQEIVGLLRRHGRFAQAFSALLRRLLSGIRSVTVLHLLSLTLQLVMLSVLA